MPDPNNLFGNEATKQLAALVRYWMQNYLLQLSDNIHWLHVKVTLNWVIQSLNELFEARSKEEAMSTGRRENFVLMSSQLVPTSPRRKEKTQLIEVK